MGWSTDLFCNITFNKKTFNTIYEVQDKKDEIEVCLKNAKDNLRDLVIMTEPNKYFPEDTMSSIQFQYNELMELIEDYTIELYKLGLLLENWDKCHTVEGLAINPPDNIHWDTAFLDGDFVNTVKNPDSNSI